GAPRVLGVGLEVGVVERGQGHPGGGAVPGRDVATRGEVDVVAHLRSPSQNATSIIAPTPKRSPMNPSATGPMPPRPRPPRLTGCWIVVVTYLTMSATCRLERLPGPKCGIWVGPVRMASAIWRG